jgi:adenine/guanine/hypoxanthine permease
MLTVLLMLYRIRGAILIGIFLTAIISWPRPTAVTYFPHNDEGDALFDYFKQVVSFHPISLIGNVINVSFRSLGSYLLTLSSSTTTGMNHCSEQKIFQLAV